jgi:hypothetical protein
MGHLVRARREPVHSGAESFTGQLASVREELNPRGRVWFDGQLWFAELLSMGAEQTDALCRSDGRCGSCAWKGSR